MSSLFDQLEDTERPDYYPQAFPQIASRGIKDIILNFETNGLRTWDGARPISATVRLPDGSIFFLPWGFRGGNHDEATAKRWAQRELRDLAILNANTRFDVQHAYAWDVDLEEQGCTVSDIQHWAALLDDHRRKFNLDVLATDFIGGPRVPRIDETRMATYHASQAEARARHQVELVHELREVFWPMLVQQNLLEVKQLEDDVIYCVCEMERNGAPLNMDLLVKWEEETKRKVSEYHFQLYRLTGMRVNPDSGKDMEKLFKSRGIPIQAYTEKGAASFTDEIVSKIDDEAVQLARKISKLTDLRSKYIVPYLESAGRTGILRYQLHQLRGDENGTVTGRFSASDRNIQQVLAIEKQIESYGPDYIIKELFIPARGLYLSSDAEQIEYRLFAHYANNPKIIAAYAANPRLHYHEYMWALLKPFKPDLKYKPLKNLNFAKIYGARHAKIALMMKFITSREFAELKAKYHPKGVSSHDPLLADVKAIMDIYSREIPEGDILLERASQIAQNRGYVMTLLKRRGRFPEAQRLHKALNNVIQGSAADIMKLKLVALRKKRKEIDFTMRMTVHDQVCGDAGDKENARLVDETLNEQSLPLRVPILWKTKTGPNWRECE